MIALHLRHPRFPEPPILFQLFLVFLEKHELGHEIVFLSLVCYWTFKHHFLHGEWNTRESGHSAHTG